MGLAADIYGVEWKHAKGKCYLICTNWAAVIYRDNEEVWRKEGIRSEYAAGTAMEAAWKRFSADPGILP